MKAILVAGGHGSRLAPFTRYTQKTLLPIHERPVIDYALGTIRRAGIQDITIIANRFIGQIAQHVGTGLPGERIHYVMEEEPLGVAHALGLARPHNENTRLLIYFSDNITTVELADHVAAFEDAVDPLALSFSLERSPTRARLGSPCWTIPVRSWTSWKSPRHHHRTLPSAVFTSTMSGFGPSSMRQWPRKERRFASLTSIEHTSNSMLRRC